MRKARLTINCDAELFDLIKQTAQANQLTVSAVAEMFLDLIRYVNTDELKRTSPLPHMLKLKPQKEILK